jgi:hypothetical protein
MSDTVIEKEVKAVVEHEGHRSDLYREITPTVFMGGVQEGCIEMIALSARTDALAYFFSGKNKQELIEEINIKLTPQQAKKLTRWLIRHIILYEKTFGKIKLLEETTPEDLVSPENIKSLEHEVETKLNELISNLRL